MRKNCARKWLHLVIDLLPVIILPIFAIWEINHKENENITVEVDNKQVVDFNQLSSYISFQNNFGVSGTVNQSSIVLNGTVSNSTTNIRLTDGITFKRDGSQYYVRFSSTSPVRIGVAGYSSYSTSYIFSAVNTTNWTNQLYLLTNDGDVYDNVSITINVFNLTQMYGRGKEPTMSAFDSVYTASYYDKVLSRKELTNNGTIVYDNTDIGSQMLYAVYKPVQQYFNFDNIFNFGALRNWFELNFFNGNMGIPMTIIWNIIIYEFLSDVIMLIYAFFMFIIDFANDLLEKPFSDIKRG